MSPHEQTKTRQLDARELREQLALLRARESDAEPATRIFVRRLPALPEAPTRVVGPAPSDGSDLVTKTDLKPGPLAGVRARPLSGARALRVASSLFAALALVVAIAWFGSKEVREQHVRAAESRAPERRSNESSERARAAPSDRVPPTELGASSADAGASAIASEPPDPRVREAVDHLLSGRSDAALAAYRALLADSPGRAEYARIVELLERERACSRREGACPP